MPATAPFASIVVPTRNRPGLLRRALESIACQSCTDYEVLVIDDGSSPQALIENRAHCAALGDRFVLVARDGAEEQHGPAAARNAGIRVARGSHVGFLDDDDYWCDADHLRLAQRACTESPDIDLYIARQIGMRGETVVVPSWLPLLDPLEGAGDASGTQTRAIGKSALLRPQGIGFAHVNMCLVRREVVDAIGGFWTGTGYEEDLDFFLRLVDASRQIVYRAATVSIHCAREQQATPGASSIDADSRLVLRMAACQHALLSCNGREVRAYARLLLAGVFKTLSKRNHQQGRHRVAAGLAWQAVVVEPSLRWLAIALTLSARGLVASSRGSS